MKIDGRQNKKNDKSPKWSEEPSLESLARVSGKIIFHAKLSGRFFPRQPLKLFLASGAFVESFDNLLVRRGPLLSIFCLIPSTIWLTFFKALL